MQLIKTIIRPNKVDDVFFVTPVLQSYKIRTGEREG